MIDLGTAGLGKGLKQSTPSQQNTVGARRQARGPRLPWIPCSQALGAGDASHGQSPFPLCASPVLFLCLFLFFPPLSESVRREGSREQVIDLEKEDWSREAGETWLSSSLGPLAEKNLTFSAGGQS